MLTVISGCEIHIFEVTGRMALEESMLSCIFGQCHRGNLEWVAVREP